MKFNLTRSVALQVLKQALRTCNTKAKGQADSEFLFKPDQNRLFITSLNETAEQNLILPCEDLEYLPGEAFSAPGQAIVEFLSQFPDEEVKCVYNADNANLVIGNKKTRFAFPTGSGTDFIPFNYQAQGRSVEVSAAALRDVLKSTAFAASHDHTQTPYTAVHLTISGTKLMAEASDTLRISRHTVEIDDVGADTIELLLPYETAETLATLFEDIATVTMQPGRRHVRFKWGDTTFTSTLENAIGKSYPELSRFMKGKELGRVKISKGNLARSLKLAALVAKDSYVTVAIKPMENDGTGGGLMISTNEAVGMSQDILVVQEQSGESEVNVAHRLFSKAIDCINSAWVVLSFRELMAGVIALVLVDGNFEHQIYPVTPSQIGNNDASEETESGDEE